MKKNILEFYYNCQSMLRNIQTYRLIVNWHYNYNNYLEALAKKYNDW